MDKEEKHFLNAINQTRIIRLCKQKLATFGTTNLKYFLLTNPSYEEIESDKEETVIRHGTVKAEQPKIVTPQYMLNLEGFSENAHDFMEELAENIGPNAPGILYQYKNNPSGMEIVSGKLLDVSRRIAEDLDKKDNNNTVVLTGLDSLWDVCLMKFIYEYTAASLTSNAKELDAMGLLTPSASTGVPQGAIQKIEQLFFQVSKGLDPGELKQELDRWGLFEHYQDRFLKLFKK